MKIDAHDRHGARHSGRARRAYPDVIAEQELRAQGFRAGGAISRRSRGAHCPQPRGHRVDLRRTGEGPGLFSDAQVELVKTFADQAVIAIENVRLSRNWTRAIATSPRRWSSRPRRARSCASISSTPTDVQPVFDIIGASAERLCDAEISVVSRIDGELIHLVAVHGASAEGTEAIRRHFPMRLDEEKVTARTIRRRAVVHVSDALADPDYAAKDAATGSGRPGMSLRPDVSRQGVVIGAIFVGRRNPVTSPTRRSSC